jgi:hypothetical protein
MFSCNGGNTFKANTLGGGYYLDFFNCKDKSEIYKSIRFDVADTLHVENYLVGNANVTACRLVFHGKIFSIFSDSLTTGNLSITSIGERSVSGKFDFKVTDNHSGEKYNCTNGNFDLSR